MRTSTALLAVLLGAVLGTVACWALVHADLAVSAHYYRPGVGFYLDHEPWVQAVYRGVPRLVAVAASGLLLALLLAWIVRTPYWRAQRGPLAYLLLTLALGPGLIVNVVLKDHWGRPRPVQITQFGGHEHYVAPTIPSAQHGHSFPSAHAAAAFYLMSFGWAVPRRRRLWWTLGLLAGAGVGYVRIVQGAHFLSDIIFAGLVVWLTAALLARWMRRRRWLPTDG